MVFKRRQNVIEYKTPAQIEKMRVAGRLVGETLELLRTSVRPGMTTLHLDAIAETHIRAAGGIPSFQGVPGGPGVPDFPATICASVNDEIVHGIPGNRTLRDGDIVSIDCGAIIDGWHGDAAITIPVGEITPALAELLRVCEEALWRGMAAARLDGRINDIGDAIEEYVIAAGAYGIVEEYVGHGIGSQMHQPPQVPNYSVRAKMERIRPGLVLAVEPMINLGGKQTRTLDDGWTVVTADCSFSAHFEHTFTVTEDGTWVLTALDGGTARLSELGSTVAVKARSG
ncbi:MAG TPA: type I methionyl aminopeptidase [Sporichthyaceae bacterium]|jgi:methionyl aminopeptidase|nr:type I methionyl aminopeptidase [Sporichthyaceae bacterium]